VGLGRPGEIPNGQTGHGISCGYFSHGPHGPCAVDLWLASVPTALLAAAIALAAFVMFNYVLVAAALTHVRVARVLLRPMPIRSPRPGDARQPRTPQLNHARAHPPATAPGSQ